MIAVLPTKLYLLFFTSSFSIFAIFGAGIVYALRGRSDERVIKVTY